MRRKAPLLSSSSSVAYRHPLVAKLKTAPRGETARKVLLDCLQTITGPTNQTYTCTHSQIYTRSHIHTQTHTHTHTHTRSICSDHTDSFHYGNVFSEWHVLSLSMIDRESGV